MTDQTPQVDLNPASPEKFPLPPGRSGLPLLGETVEYLRSSRDFTERRFRQYGGVFRSHVLGSPTVFLVGPEAMQWIFAGEGKYLKNRWSNGVRQLLGANCLSLIEGDEHLERRRLLAPHFSYATMRGFVPVIESLATRHFERWAAQPGDFTLWPSMRELAFEIALTLIFGQDAVDVPFLTRHFQTWTAGLFVPFPVNLPWTMFGRAMASKKAMIDYLDKVVAERQKRTEQPPDLLGSLLQHREDGEQPLSRETIVEELQLLLFAGHDTTVTATSNLMLLLAQHPDVLQRGREAVASLEGPLTLDGLRAMPYLAQLIQEGMRLIPPIGGAFRVTTRDVIYNGYRIPKGWTVPVGIRYAHGGANWPDSERFDPDRFSAERNEHKKSGTFIPFGGGPRICLGQHFAMVEMSVMLALLLKHYTWELVPGQDLEYTQIPFPKPKSGIQLRVRRLG
ncbi:cytochrome P450 [Vitiosangium sp. GDMCC 1.1324]|uniref:cytochrome P450 n=1 Tax=Vitiosangium sp. (strain GDMCC 1.1324) TaxID=2138576 RepID=UPI000D39EBBF|nr:cytochrome P450 [Vitiosangium sp. GDMCC 1.1324]PTL82996.1 cytochrome P450 [Vitiosangium sp. GDMCC 1.1324]